MTLFRFYILLLFTCLTAVNSASAQEPQTIKFKKESLLSKAVFDNTDPRLFVIDRYGNPRENRILSYSLHVKTKKETVKFEGFSNTLNGEMLNFLNKQTSACKLFLDRKSVV